MALAVTFGDRTAFDRLRKVVANPQAEAAASSALAAYRVGSVDFMTLVDAQMTLNEYRQEQYALLAEYGSLIAELEMAIGRELPATDTTIVEEV